MLSYRSTSRMLGRCVCPCLVYLTCVEFLSAHISQQQTVKRSDETHEFCKISYPLSVLSVLTDHYRPMRELQWLHRVSDAPQFFSSCRSDPFRARRFIILPATFLESKRFKMMCDDTKTLLSLYHLVCMLKDVKAIQKS